MTSRILLLVTLEAFWVTADLPFLCICYAAVRYLLFLRMSTSVQVVVHWVLIWYGAGLEGRALAVGELIVTGRSVCIVMEVAVLVLVGYF